MPSARRRNDLEYPCDILAPSITPSSALRHRRQIIPRTSHSPLVVYLCHPKINCDINLPLQPTSRHCIHGNFDGNGVAHIGQKLRCSTSMITILLRPSGLAFSQARAMLHRMDRNAHSVENLHQPRGTSGSDTIISAASATAKREGFILKLTSSSTEGKIDYS